MTEIKLPDEDKGVVAKQQIPAIYGPNTFRYGIHIVELLIFATTPAL